MQYTVLVDNFGGLNTYMSPDKVGPSGAVESTAVDISNGSLRTRFADTKATLSSGVYTGYDTYVPDNSKVIVPWGVGALGMTTRYAVARFGGRLYRSHKGFGAFPSTLTGIQYTSSIGGGATPTLPTWDYLGLMTPGVPNFTVAVSGSGSAVQPGEYYYYCTFANDLDQESPPVISSKLTVSTARDVTVTLPQAYTLAYFNNGATGITVDFAERLRVGMRITGTYIPANTYVTSIDSPTGSALVGISNATTGASGAGGVYIRDAQITKVNIYRQGGNVDAPLFVKSVAIGTSSTPDNVLDNDLGDMLETLSSSNIPTGLRDISISPQGVLLCAGPGNTIVYMSLVTPEIYNASRFIKVSDSPLATIYALDRFVCPTIRGAFTVSIDDAILGIPVIQQIDDTEPCQVSYNVYPVDVGGEVWWNTNKGIVSTNGSTIETFTKYTFSRTLAENCLNCYAADFYNGEYIAYLGSGQLISYTRQSGWTIITDSMKTSTNAGALGWHINDGCMIFTGWNETPAAVRRLYKSTTRTSGGTYKTGDWSGDKLSSLKKFRKFSAVFTGSVQFQLYVDGIAVGNALQGTNSTIGRVSWWLPSGTKGRTFSVSVLCLSSNVEIEELGLWVGEQREPMP